MKTLGNKQLLDGWHGPSNPLTFFVSGGETKSFTFPERKNGKLFWVLIYGGSYISLSAIIKADSENDVISILTEGVEFSLNCKKKRFGISPDTLHPELAEMYEGQTESANQVLALLRGENVEKLAILIKEAQFNQIYKVGWAGNDTVNF